MARESAALVRGFAIRPRVSKWRSSNPNWPRRLEPKFAVAVGSGTAAIELCLRAAGMVDIRADIRADSEVIVPALTSPFTAPGNLAAGAVRASPTWMPNTCCSMRKAPRPASVSGLGAIVPVHLYGQPCDISWAPRGLTVAQDACQAHGASDPPGLSPAFHESLALRRL